MVSPLLSTYAVYIGASLVMVLWVGRTLFTNGSVFLRDVFRGDPELAAAVNRLLLVGFYLVSLGFVLLTSSLGADDLDPAARYQALSVKLGGVAITIGLMHLINLSGLHRTRQRRLMESRRPPAPPSPVTQHATAPWPATGAPGR